VTTLAQNIENEFKRLNKDVADLRKTLKKILDCNWVRTDASEELIEISKGLIQRTKYIIEN